MRFTGFLHSKPVIQLLASSEIVFQISLENLIFFERIFLNISFSVLAMKGGLPESAQYVITPKLQLSHF